MIYNKDNFKNSIPSTTCRQMMLLDSLFSIPFDSCNITAWYFPSSSLHTDGMTSCVSVLPVYFSLLVLIISVISPLSFCHLINQRERSIFFTSALKFAVHPHTTSSSPFMTICGSSNEIVKTR